MRIRVYRRCPPQLDHALPGPKWVAAVYSHGCCVAPPVRYATFQEAISAVIMWLD